MAVQTGVLPDRYAGARSIGHGGMGKIYVAEDRLLGRRVAIKVLDERIAADERLRRRFRLEALTAARLSGHPHVVTIYDVGEWQGRPFVVMEFLPGGTLGDLARSGRFEYHDALRWLAQAADALDAAHNLGVVHRGVKPTNLLFDARGNVVVTDFAIGLVANETTRITLTRTALDEGSYLAPEQAVGQSATPASDRYALGIIAYELLTGGRPFEHSSTTKEAAAHIQEPAPPASERGAGLARSLDAVFERALAKDPHARYATAAEFVHALRTAFADRKTTRTPPALPPLAGTPRAEAPRPDERRRRSPAPALALAALILALVGGVAAAVLATRDGTRESAVTPPQKREQVTVTKRETTTVAGGTVVSTVVTTAQVEPSPPVGAAAGSIEEAVRLTDESTYALRRADWEEAAGLARRAYPTLEGTYADDFRYEAYVNYDLGKALAKLGRCRQALRYLGRSEALQGHRSQIDDARAECD